MAAIIASSLAFLGGCDKSSDPATGGGSPEAGAAAPAPVPVQAPAGTPRAAGPRIEFARLSHDFGNIWDVTTHTQFAFTNTGSETLRITVVKGRCSCTQTSLAKMSYAPGEKGVIEVAFDPNGFGAQDKKIDVVSNARPEPRTVLTLNGNVSKFLKIEPTFVRFGEIALGAQHRRTISVSSPDPTFVVESVRPVWGPAGGDESKIGAQVAARLVEPATPDASGRREIEATVLEGAPWGTLYAAVEITWSGHLAPDAERTTHTEVVPINASVFGRLRANEQRFSAGVIKPGESYRSTVELSRNDGGPFRMIDVRIVSDRALNAQVSYNELRVPGVVGYEIVLTGTAGGAGPIAGTVEITTDVPGEETIGIRISGVAK